MNVIVSMYYEKQDKMKIIRDITYNIGNEEINLENYNNRQDIDIIKTKNEDSKYIRKEMLLNEQDFYYLYVYIITYSKNIEELKINYQKIDSILKAKGIRGIKAYFRQEQTYLSCLPLMINHNDVKNASKFNILTDGLVSTYPFISSSIYDYNGIFIGENLYNNSLIFINKYNNQKYKNSNICIFGTSGAGKSFFTKLSIIRYSMYNVDQYIIDPEREYTNLVRALDGTIIKLGPNSNTYINIFDIRKESLEKDEKGYLASKIIKLNGFFNLLFGELNEEEKAILEEKIIKIYENKGINFNDKSLFNINNKFKESYEMPILEDLYNELNLDHKTKKFKIKLIPFIKGSLSFFNNYTNIKIESKLIIADVYELGEENLKLGMYIFTELFWDKIKENRNKKKSIYLDEIWRLIGVTSNREVASFVYKIFKTIRKYGGSAVAITQDIYDLFSLDKGNFGRSIINNSSIKYFFKLEEENIEILDKYLKLTEKEKYEIKTFEKGQSLMCVGENHILAKIISFDYEKNIIEKGEY